MPEAKRGDGRCESSRRIYGSSPRAVNRKSREYCTYKVCSGFSRLQRSPSVRGERYRKEESLSSRIGRVHRVFYEFRW